MRAWKKKTSRKEGGGETEEVNGSMPVLPHGEQVKNLALDASAISLGVQPDDLSSS